MICPICQTPNPDDVPACLQCTHRFVAEAIPLSRPAVEAGELTSVPTMGSPSSFKEWASRSQSAASSVVLPAGLEIGRRYRVKSLLGMGGMGAVYLVHDKDLDRDVALKLIRSDIADDPDSLERFKREIQLSSRVTHPNVLRVFDLGESDGIKFLTMQFVDGRDLSTILKKQGKLPNERLLKIFRQAAEGLKAAHDQGVVHRDLKPQNIMIDGHDRVYLTDFGLAKSAEQSAMTQTGAVIGTPFYMSPEQVKGDPVDQRSDIYALGVILYQMAAGAVPFTGATPFEVMMRRMQRPAQPIGELNTGLPRYLQKITERCMATDPNLRYQNVAEILEDLDAENVRSSPRYTGLMRRWMKPAIAAAVVAILLAAGGIWIARTAGRSVPTKKGAPKIVSVLIADFQNKTGEPVFDGTLEPAFSIAMEGAPFISAYNRAGARKIAGQLQPGTTGLPEAAARLVAVREGVNVVVSGSVEKKGSGYEVAVQAVDAATGKAIVSEKDDASSRDKVLQAAATLATGLRTALGDKTPPSVQQTAAETFSAGSLEAAHEYAIAQDLQWAGKWDEAIQHYNRAVELDKNMGRAYAGLAAVESNRGRPQDAARDYQLALARMDRMSDREKYRTRGGYFLLTRKPDSAIEEFTTLVKQYPADTAGLANLAFAYFVKRDMANALEWGRKAIEIYPKNVPQRNNYGLIAMYAGDFEIGVREQKTVLSMNPNFVLAYVGLALSELGMGQPAEALATWNKLATIGPAGASAAAAGLADLALYQGRVSDARPILDAAIESDLTAKNTDEAARKLTTLAEAHLEAGQAPKAIAAAERALSLSQDLAVSVSAGRVLIEAGEEAKALAIAAKLEERLEPDPQMYALVLRGEAELKRRNFRDAIMRFKEARKIADSWLTRFDLARAYVEAGSFTEADTELDACIKRRGEATAVYLDEVPTFRIFPPVYYYLGRSRQGLKSPDAAEAYKTFLGFQTGEGGPLAADARKRSGQK
jgi:tetratricopeptide (TPR) repeat protein/predicted Ser/Thr protein kinase